MADEGERLSENTRENGANFWIEVTSGMRWKRMLAEKNVVLEAPNRTRYQTFFTGVKSGDIVLHYITTALTLQKELQSKVVAVSRIVSSPTVTGRKIIAPCSNTLILPKYVPLDELRKLKHQSPQLRKLVINLRMQRYLSRISRSDFEPILRVYPINMRRLSKSRLGKWLKHSI